MPVVAIIGGGISGLSVAEALSRHGAAAGLGLQPIVLEAEREPGGKIRTIREQGYVVETGPHGFLDKEPKFNALVERLGLTASLLPANEAAERRYVVRGGKLRLLPAKPPQFLTSDILPLFAKLRVALEPLIAKKRGDEEESVWSFAARRLGRQAADVLVDAMVTGIYGGDPKRLSVRAAFPLLEQLEAKHGSLIKGQIAVSKARKQLGAGGGQFGGPRGRMHSFQNGLGELIDALAARADVRRGFRAAEAEVQGGLQIRSEAGDVLAADALVVTAPAFEMARLFGGRAEGEARLLEQIAYAEVAVVVQAFSSQVMAGAADGFGFLVPHLEAREVLGSIWASSVFEGHAPKDRVMMRTILGGARRPEHARGDDATLSARARREVLGLLGKPPGTVPEYERIIRWERGIPQYELGHGEKVAAADALERRLPGVFLGGNGLRGVAMIACVADADRVAEKVVRWLAQR